MNTMSTGIRFIQRIRMIMNFGMNVGMNMMLTETKYITSVQMALKLGLNMMPTGT